MNYVSPGMWMLPGVVRKTNIYWQLLFRLFHWSSSITNPGKDTLAGNREERWSDKSRTWLSIPVLASSLTCKCHNFYHLERFHLMVQNQLLFMCKLDGFPAIIIREDKLEKHNGIEKTRWHTIKNQTGKSDEQNLTKEKVIKMF